MASDRYSHVSCGPTIPTFAKKDYAGVREGKRRQLAYGPTPYGSEEGAADRPLFWSEMTFDTPAATVVPARSFARRSSLAEMRSLFSPFSVASRENAAQSIIRFRFWKSCSYSRHRAATIEVGNGSEPTIPNGHGRARHPFDHRSISPIG